MRRFALNLLTVSGTVVVLALVSLPAWSVHERVHHRASPAAQATTLTALARPLPRRLFGVYVDPWHVNEWSARVGARPSLVAKFEAFSRRRTADRFLRQAERDGVTRVMVSWEPWKPVPAPLGWRRQARPQPGYTNRAIAVGMQDAYIAKFARSLASFRGIVYLRYAHEMNGFWYPWSADPRAYVRAWRHIVRIVRKEHASNVRFVWSVNPSLYETRKTWLRKLRRYWPGSGYVDAVGSTMINFGGVKNYTVARFQPVLVTLRRVFRKPVHITETNTGWVGRVRWLRGLRRVLRRHRWIRNIVWSQLPSRGQAQQRRAVGDLNWSVTSDRPAAAVLRAIARDGSR